jgi:hypothetical protein
MALEFHYFLLILVQVEKTFPDPDQRRENWPGSGFCMLFTASGSDLKNSLEPQRWYILKGSSRPYTTISLAIENRVYEYLSGFFLENLRGTVPEFRPRVHEPVPGEGTEGHVPGSPCQLYKVRLRIHEPVPRQWNEGHVPGNPCQLYKVRSRVHESVPGEGAEGHVPGVHVNYKR